MPQKNEDNLEREILSALLNYSTVPDQITVHTRQFGFSENPRHDELYAAIWSLNSIGMPVDLISVCECLKERERLEDTGGSDYIADIMRIIVSSVGVIDNMERLFGKNWSNGFWGHLPKLPDDPHDVEF